MAKSAHIKYTQHCTLWNDLYMQQL